VVEMLNVQKETQVYIADPILQLNIEFIGLDTKVTS